MELSDLTSDIISLPEKGFFLALKIFFIIFSLFLAFGIIYLLRLTDWYEKRFALDLRDLALGKSKEKAGKLAKGLKKIKKRLEKPNPAEYKLAVIETASLLSKVLARQGFKGENLLDQIEKAGPDIFSPTNLEELLEAYQVGSNIVNDPDYKLSLKKARETIDIFERNIQNLFTL